MEELQTLIKNEKNFKVLRECLNSLNPPLVPYLGIFIQDLLAIDESFPNNDENGWVNILKRRKWKRT